MIIPSNKITYPVDTTSLLSLNKSKKSSVLSANNIEDLNSMFSTTTTTPSSSNHEPHLTPNLNQQDKPLPSFKNKIQKGQKLALNLPSNSQIIKACLGWNVTNSLCDLDVSAFLLSENGRVIGDDWFVFYGQEYSPDKSTHFQIINDRSDREVIQINLAQLNPAIQKIVFVLTINDALKNNLNFSMVKDAYLRIMDSRTNQEFVSYLMTDYYSNVISMMIGELYRHNGVWKINAIGNGVSRDLEGLCKLYGVQVV